MAINLRLQKWLIRTLAEKPEVTQVELARLLTDQTGLQYDRSKINKMIQGKRNITDTEGVAIAHALNVRLPTVAPEVPLVGYIEAGAILHMLSDGQGAFDIVEGPADAGPETVAVKVRGDSMYGIADDGWLLFYDKRQAAPTDDLFHKVCAVGLRDGRIMVKKIKRGSLPERFDLYSSNAPTIENAEVEWCAKIRWFEQP